MTEPIETPDEDNSIAAKRTRGREQAVVRREQREASAAARSRLDGPVVDSNGVLQSGRVARGSRTRRPQDDAVVSLLNRLATAVDEEGIGSHVVSHPMDEAVWAWVVAFEDRQAGRRS